MRDMIPSVSNILKIPQRGPFQIQEIKERNVVLLDLDTGQTINTHLELIRPLDLKEFKFFLNKIWDLNAHHQKSVDTRQNPGIFDEPNNPIPTELLSQFEPPDDLVDEIDLEDLFYPPPVEAEILTNQASLPVTAQVADFDAASAADQTDADMSLPTVSDQNDQLQDEIDQNETNACGIGQAKTSAFGTGQTKTGAFGTGQTKTNAFGIAQPTNAFGIDLSEVSQINSLHAYSDLSKEFKNSLTTKKEKLLTFFLSKKDQYVKLPAMDDDVD